LHSVCKPFKAMSNDIKFSSILQPGNGNFQYVQDVNGIFLNVRFFVGRVVQRFLILPIADSPGLSSKSPFPGCMAMTG